MRAGCGLADHHGEWERLPAQPASERRTWAQRHQHVPADESLRDVAQPQPAGRGPRSPHTRYAPSHMSFDNSATTFQLSGCEFSCTEDVLEYVHCSVIRPKMHCCNSVSTLGYSCCGTTLKVLVLSALVYPF